MARGVRVQRICEIILMKISKIAIRKNLGPQKFCAIRYTVLCTNRTGKAKYNPSSENQQLYLF